MNRLIQFYPKILAFSFLSVLSAALFMTGFAAPVVHLQEGGAYYWSNSGTIVHGCFPLNDGARVMVVFYENRATDGVAHLFYQIIGENLEPEFDPPRQFSAENSAPYPGNAFIDDDGNIFIAWLARRAGFDNVNLYAQKFSPDGEPLWDGDPHLVGTIRGAPADGDIPNMMSDWHGGFYYLNAWRYLAIDEEGQFRENWPWSERRPDPDLGMIYYLGRGAPRRIFNDQIGGIWYEVMGERDTVLYNHVDYRGEKLWDTPLYFNGYDMRADRWQNNAILIGHNGGLLGSTGLLDHPWTTYFFTIDANGNIPDRNYLYIDQVFVYLSNEVIRRRRGDYVFSTYNDVHNVRTYALTAYNPANNSFPWGISGVGFARFNDDDDGFTSIIELSSEDIVGVRAANPENGPNQFVYFDRIRSNGGLAWRMPVQFGDFFPRFLAATPDDGFWACGTSTAWTGGTEINHLNRFNRNGQKEAQESIIFKPQERSDPQLPQLWIDEGGHYRYLFCQPWLGYKMVTLSPGGEIIGDPNGSMILADRNQSRFSRFSQRVNGLNIFFESYTHAVALNDDGEVVWEHDYDIPNWAGNIGVVRYFVSPDSQDIFVMRATTQYNGAREEAGIVARFSVFDGEMHWSHSTPVLAPYPQISGGFAFALSYDAAYHVLDWTSDSGAIYSTGYDGEPLTERPYIFYRDLDNSKIFGTVATEDGGFWIGFVERSDDGLDCYLQKFERERGFTRRIYPYAEPWRGEYVWDNDNLPYQLCASNEFIWIIPNQAIDMGIQCLTQAGERLIGDYGWNHETPILRSENDYLKSLPDGEGGLWVALRSTQVGVRAFHFDPDSGLSGGWSPEGEAIATIDQQPSLEEIYALPERNLIVTYAGTAAVVGNPLVSGSGNFYFQHLSDFRPDDAGAEDRHSPVTFQLLSLYPQPFNSRLNLVWQAPRNSKVLIRAYDLTGRLVFESTQISHQAGVRSMSIDASEWQSGIYFLTVDDGAATFSRKTILLK